ncbi:MAG: hypothetical protein ACJAUD_002181 [Crocinitomicaceae bacterium]|jgi:hypothetical protein
MTFERAIAHPKLRNEFIVVKWSKAYKSTEIWYRGRLLKSIHGIKALKQKVIFKDDEVGKVEVFLVENPFTINIIVDDIHSFENAKYPLKTIKNIGNWIIPAVIVHLLTVFTMVHDIYYTQFYVVGSKDELMYHAFFLICHLFSFVLIRLNNPMYYLISLIAYYFNALVILYFLLIQKNGDFTTTWTMAGIYFIYCLLLLIPLKKLIIYRKHKLFDFTVDENVLDDYN